MEYDMKNNVKTEVGFLEDAAGASTDSAVIDTQLFDSLTWLVSSGTITTGTFTTVFEESDVVTFGGEETVVPAAEVIGSIAFAVDDDDVSKRVGIIGKKRFQRMTLVGASTPVAQMNGTALLGHPKHHPTAD